MNEHKQDVIGIDVSKSTLDFALLRNNKLKHKVFKNTPAGHQAALNWLQKNKIKEAHICLESTNIYGDAIATLLYDAGYSVSIVNPARVKGFSQSELLRTKTDKSDAGLIARFCLAMNPSLWTPDPQETREMNAPPAKSRWFRVTAESRSFRLKAIYNTLKSSSGSFGFWFSMYAFQTSSVTFPLEATQ